jgi:hypothetical protein
VDTIGATASLDPVTDERCPEDIIGYDEIWCAAVIMIDFHVALPSGPGRQLAIASA